MAKAKSTRRRRAPPPQTRTKPEVKYADAALIRLCITIRAELAAHHGCWKAPDPDGSSAHIEPIGARHATRAFQAIEKAAAFKATTWAGLASKANVVPVILDDDEGSAEVRSEAFYRSFAADAERLAKDAVEKDRQAARAQAEKVAA